jgi:hypothetical protein
VTPAADAEVAVASFVTLERKATTNPVIITKKARTMTSAAP